MNKSVIEFYCGDACVTSVEAPMVPTVGSFISIRKRTYRIDSVGFAIDHADDPLQVRVMRCNVELSEVRRPAKEQANG